MRRRELGKAAGRLNPHVILSDPHPLNHCQAADNLVPRAASRDAQWIIGAIVAATVALSVQIAGIRTDVRRLDDRLRAVEVEFGKVEQRLATLERLHLPNPADN